MSDAAKPEPTPYDKMCNLTRQVLSVPKKEIDRRAEEWKRKRAEKKVGRAPNGKIA